MNTTVQPLDIWRRASDLGTEHGNARGSWVVDGNSSNEFCEKLIQGHEDGDPEVMDLQPSPLSGEWADEPTVSDILRELGIQPDTSDADMAIECYEEGFSNAWWHTVIQAAHIGAGHDPCPVCKLYGHGERDHYCTCHSIREGANGVSYSLALLGVSCGWCESKMQEAEREEWWASLTTKEQVAQRWTWAANHAKYYQPRPGHRYDNPWGDVPF